MRALQATTDTGQAREKVNAKVYSLGLTRSRKEIGPQRLIQWTPRTYTTLFGCPCRDRGLPYTPAGRASPG
jgi:hypothetical protein